MLLRRVWQQRPSCLRPIRCSLHGDRHLGETIVNVLTSLPFVAIGIQTPRKNLNCKIYANSLIGVGVASSLYHVSRGSLRKYTRWDDYTMIANNRLQTPGRESIAAKLVANLITEAGVDRVLACDLNSGQSMRYFDIPVDHVHGQVIPSRLQEQGQVRNSKPQDFKKKGKCETQSRNMLVAQRSWPDGDINPSKQSQGR